MTDEERPQCEQQLPAEHPDGPLAKMPGNRVDEVRTVDEDEARRRRDRRRADAERRWLPRATAAMTLALLMLAVFADDEEPRPAVDRPCSVAPPAPPAR